MTPTNPCERSTQLQFVGRRRQRQRRRNRRRGLSLIEVMLSTTMLLICVMALSRVAFLARRHATSAEDRGLAQVYCQNIMHELLAGIRPMANVAPEFFEGEQWLYMVEVESVEGSALTAVTVVVDRVSDSEEAMPTEQDMQGFRLVRWVHAVKSQPGAFGEGGLESMDPNGFESGAEMRRESF